MNTIAVGPLELAASWVTGGTGVAKDRNCSAPPRCHDEVVGLLVSFEMVDCDALFVSWLMGALKAMLRDVTGTIEEICYDINIPRLSCLSE